MSIPTKAALLVSLALLAVARLPAQGICWQENAGPTYNDGVFIGPGNWVTAVKLTSPVALTITGIEVFSGEITGDATVSVWSHDPVGELPVAKLAQGQFQLQMPNGFQGADLAVPQTVAPLQPVWIAWSLPFLAQSPVDELKQVPGQYYRTKPAAGEWTGPYLFNSSHFKFRLRGPCAPSTGYTTDYGPACGNSAAPPVLIGGGVPAAAHWLSLHVLYAAPSQPAILLWGAAKADVPFLGCRVLVGNTLLGLPVAPDFRGEWWWSAALQAPLPAVDLFAQLVFIDPAQAGGIGATQGLEIAVR